MFVFVLFFNLKSTKVKQPVNIIYVGENVHQNSIIYSCLEE